MSYLDWRRFLGYYS